MQLAGNDGTARKPFYRLLYVQVLIAIVLGFLVGWMAPDIAESPWMKALGAVFGLALSALDRVVVACLVRRIERERGSCPRRYPPKGDWSRDHSCRNRSSA